MEKSAERTLLFNSLEWCKERLSQPLQRKAKSRFFWKPRDPTPPGHPTATSSLGGQSDRMQPSSAFETTLIVSGSVSIPSNRNNGNALGLMPRAK